MTDPYLNDGLIFFPPGTLTELIRRERAKEREECAKVCEDIDLEHEGEDVLASWCAAAIRARNV